MTEEYLTGTGLARATVQERQQNISKFLFSSPRFNQLQVNRWPLLQLITELRISYVETKKRFSQRNNTTKTEVLKYIEISCMGPT